MRSCSTLTYNASLALIHSSSKSLGVFVICREYGHLVGLMLYCISFLLSLTALES
nr:MAG TPA: Metallo-peptidase family M12 [Caudoviricetes sp.]